MSHLKKYFFFCFIFTVFLLSGFAKTSKSSKTKEKTPSKVKVVEVVSDEGAFQTKNVETQVGNIKILLKAPLGSFQFYAVNKDNVSVPVLASYDDSTSSFFSILAGKTEYRLVDNAGVVIGTRKSKNGAQIVYVVPGVARLFVKFDAMKTIPSGNENVLKVTATLKNRGKRTEEFALKNVLDTVFGEQKGPHFSTAEEISINSETQLRKIGNMKWIKSENAKTGIQILLSGADITSPEVVTFSNKDFLELSSWIPQVVRARSFNSIISYNNSAVCLNWEKTTLPPDAEITYTYYIMFKTDGDDFDGDAFIKQLEKSIEENGEVKKYSVKEFEDAYQEALKLSDDERYNESMEVILSLWKKPEHRNGRLESLKNYVESQMDARTAESFEKRFDSISNGQGDSFAPLVSGDESKVSQNQNDSSKPENRTKNVDYSYVQEFIDRINALESSDNIDRNELDRLNAELDAMIKNLREE